MTPLLLQGRGADNQIRTGDLMLTKHVLYQLSHISKLFLTTITIIYYTSDFVNRFFKLFFKKYLIFFHNVIQWFL